MPLTAYITISPGKRKRRCHSLIANFIGFLRIGASQAAGTIVDNDGVPYSQVPASSLYRMNGGIGDEIAGITLGTGVTPVDIEDFNLETPLTHGSSAGQLFYGGSNIGAPVRSGASYYFPITRTFTNNTASSITVNEVGLRTWLTAHYPMIFREIIPPTTWTPGQARTVVITFLITP